MSINKNKALLLLVFLAGCSLDTEFFQHSSQDIRGTVCISEIHYAGIEDTEGRVFPDSDFIELKNYTHTVVDISRWTLEVRGIAFLLITVPLDTVLGPGEVYTLAGDGEVFPGADLICSDLSLSAAGFRIILRNGSSSMIADYISFVPPLPAGLDYPGLRSSMVRQEDFFGAVDAEDHRAWVSYYPFSPVNIPDGFHAYASPGSTRGPSQSMGVFQ